MRACAYQGVKEIMQGSHAYVKEVMQATCDGTEAVTQRCSVKCVFRNFAKFTGKHLRLSLIFNKLLKKRLWHRCFPVNSAKFLRTLSYRSPLVAASDGIFMDKKKLNLCQVSNLWINGAIDNCLRLLILEFHTLIMMIMFLGICVHVLVLITKN